MAAVATATKWTTNFVVFEITPIGIENIGWKFWIVWAVFNAAFIPVIYLFYPETSNRTLENLDAYYRSDPTLLVIREPELDEPANVEYDDLSDDEIWERAHRNRMLS
ncbi:uncharacterized protein BDW70DRAFT_159964 [Aspergillus foveolatus]|uniref:uncharacterized protein n=1 Tax=Aspergillus foveolatus TaxID=210207 RepID=UPI003CCE4878